MITELTKAEEQVMQILWKLERGMTRDVLEQFPDPKPAYNTVSTIIRILERKEVVSHKAYGKNFEYFPLISKKDYAKSRFNHVFENYFSGSFPKLATFFAKDNKLSLDEFDDLMSMIREEVKKENEKEWIMGLYVIKSSLVLVIFLTYYWFILRRDTTFKTNRVYLLSSLILSIIVPVIQISRYAESKTVQTVSEIIRPIHISTYQVAMYTPEMISWWTLQHILMLIYIIGAFLILVKYIWQIIPWIKLTSKGQKSDVGFSIIKTDKSIPPFSFFNTIFLGNQEFSEKELNNIISHEKEHIQQYHWFDLLIVDILSIVFWFNPLIWIYDLLIKQNHEYLADNRVIAQGFNKSSYQTLLLQQVVGVKLPGLSSSFTQSLIKNRFIMMTKQNSKKIAGIKALFALPLLLLITILFAANSNSTFNTDIISVEKGKIKGYVIDASNNEPLAGASIALKDNYSIGVSSDIKGYFELETEIENPNIIISFVGYKTGMAQFKGQALKVLLEKEQFNIEYQKQERGFSTQDAPPPPPVKNIETTEAPPPPSSDEVWFVIEDLPLPQGGFDGLSNYINKQVAANKSDEVEGANVFVFFVITEKGEVSNVKVLKSSGIEKVDKLAVNIIEGMPNWKPGFQLNKNVPVEYTINVEF